MLIEENANRLIERIERSEIIVEQSECFESFLFSLTIVTDEYGIRLEISVNVLVYLEVILIKSALGYAQTRPIVATDAAIWTYGLADDLLYLVSKLG